MDRGRDRLLEFRHQILDRVHQRHGVGARRLLDRDALGRTIVEPRAGTGVLHRIDDVAHILDAHRRAVAIGDDQLPVRLCVEQLVVGLQRDHLVLALDRTFGLVDGRVHERAAHVLEADAVRGERRRIDLHPRGVQFLAEDRHLPDPGHRRQPLAKHQVRVVVELVVRHRVRMDGIDHDREIRRIDLAVGRRARQVLGQQSARRVDRGHHVARRAVDVARQVKLQGDRRRPDAGERGHLVERRDLGELLLERRGDRRGHGLRAGAGIARGWFRVIVWENRRRWAAGPPAADCRPRCQTPAPPASTARWRSAVG